MESIWTPKKSKKNAWKIQYADHHIPFSVLMAFFCWQKLPKFGKLAEQFWIEQWKINLAV